MRHIIRKQQIDLTLPKGCDGFALQQLVSEHFKNKLINELNEAFNTVSTEIKIISIDKLVIDFGEVSLKDFESGKWSMGLVEKTIKAIRESEVPHDIINKTYVINAEKYVREYEQWIFYMKHGFLSWNTVASDEKWFEEVLLTFKKEPDALQQLKLLIEKDKNACERMVLQHNEKQLISLFEILIGCKLHKFKAIMFELVSAMEFVANRSINSKERKIFVSEQTQIGKNIWMELFYNKQFDGEGISENKIIERLLGLFFNQEQLLKITGSKMVSAKLKNIIGIINQLVITGSDKKNTTLNDKGNPKNKIKAVKPEDDKNLPDQLSEGEHEKERLTSQETFQNNKEHKTLLEEGLFIPLAGVVLLHPFLNLLFKNLELVYEDTFVDKEAQQKAMYLIYYMATGKTKPQEHELVIAKVLCQYPLQMPVDSSISLSKTEKNEADEVLASLIGQWTVLKNTSIHGLRESFLQRNAKLFTMNNKTYLQLENDTIDVLLDYFPMNISMIKLPWMKEILWVEWR